MPAPFLQFLIQQVWDPAVRICISSRSTGDTAATGPEPTLPEPLLKGARADRTSDVVRDLINLDVYGKTSRFLNIENKIKY